jgi:hypothetical protein
MSETEPPPATQEVPATQQQAYYFEMIVSLLERINSKLDLIVPKPEKPKMAGVNFPVGIDKEDPKKP